MNAREKWKNQHWGGKARDLKRGATVTEWGVEVHQSAVCFSVAGMVTQGACVCGLGRAHADSVAAACSS